jgi:hypothetical protein
VTESSATASSTFSYHWISQDHILRRRRSHPLIAGLGWFADDEGAIDISVKIAGKSRDEARFFGLVETLGAAAVPALTRLLEKMSPARVSDRPHAHFFQWHRENCFKQ